MDLLAEYEVIDFCCDSCLLEDALDTLRYINKMRDGEYSSVVIFGGEYLAENILETFLSLRNVDEVCFDVEKVDLDKVDYAKEYAITIYMEQFDVPHIILSIEKAMDEDSCYKYFGEHHCYIDVECDDELIVHQMESDSEIDIFSLGNV
jgi:hypothetical protein